MRVKVLFSISCSSFAMTDHKTDDVSDDVCCLVTTFIFSNPISVPKTSKPEKQVSGTDTRDLFSIWQLLVVSFLSALTTL